MSSETAVVKLVQAAEEVEGVEAAGWTVVSSWDWEEASTDI